MKKMEVAVWKGMLDNHLDKPRVMRTSLLSIQPCLFHSKDQWLFYRYSHAYFTQRPITRARAQQLNYQVKSFLAVQTNYPPNEVLLNPCDDFLMIRNLKYEPDWRMDYNDNKQVEGGMRKERFFAKTTSTRGHIKYHIDRHYHARFRWTTPLCFGRVSFRGHRCRRFSSISTYKMNHVLTFTHSNMKHQYLS